MSRRFLRSAPFFLAVFLLVFFAIVLSFLVELVVVKTFVPHIYKALKTMPFHEAVFSKYFSLWVFIHYSYVVIAVAVLVALVISIVVARR